MIFRKDTISWSSSYDNMLVDIYNYLHTYDNRVSWNTSV